MSWVTICRNTGRSFDFISLLVFEVVFDVNHRTGRAKAQKSIHCLNWWWRERNDFYASGNLTIFYKPIELNLEGWLWSQQLELYLGIQEQKLRLFTSESQLVLTEAEYERQPKELAQQRAEQLAAKLRELNIDPDEL